MTRLRVVPGIVLALSVAACYPDPIWPEVVYVVPRNFTGWICVDFDVKTGPPLPREGRTLVVRSRGNEIIQTSDRMPKADGWLWFDDEPLRLPLNELEFGAANPDDVGIMQSVSMSGTNEPFQRHCNFVGTVDQSDAAGNPPGFTGGRFDLRPVSAAERAALIALYEATDGPNWTHKFGWRGPSGTECKWHGVECEPDPKGPTTWVTKLSLHGNNLRGTMPESLGVFEHLETISLPHEVTGQLPVPLIRRWLAGDLEVFGTTAWFTHITEIELEYSASESACDRYRIVLRDSTAWRFGERCRGLLPWSGRAGCEEKEGWLDHEDFARAAHTIELSYFSPKPEYRRRTPATPEIIRVTRNSTKHQVSDYSGPRELRTIRDAIVSASMTVVRWDGKAVPCP